MHRHTKKRHCLLMLLTTSSARKSCFILDTNFRHMSESESLTSVTKTVAGFIRDRPSSRFQMESQHLSLILLHIHRAAS